MPPVRDLDAGRAAEPAVHRVHRGLQHLVLPGLLRARDRHHPHAPGRHARLRPVPPRHRRGRADARRASTSSTTARRSCTSAPSRCASTSRPSFPHIYLYTSTNGLALTEEQGAPPGALRHRRGHLLDRRRHAGQLRALSPARHVRRRARTTCARWPTRRRRSGRDVPQTQLALHPVQLERQRRGDGARARSWPPRSASIACAGRSPTIPRTPSRAGSSPGSADLERIRHEIWDDNNLGNAIPGATPRARIDVRTLVPGLPAARPRAQPLTVAHPGPQPVDAAVPRPGELRTPAGAARRPAARRTGTAAQPRSTRAPGSRATSRRAAVPTSASTCPRRTRRDATR